MWSWKIMWTVPKQFLEGFPGEGTNKNISSYPKSDPCDVLWWLFFCPAGAPRIPIAFVRYLERPRLASRHRRPNGSMENGRMRMMITMMKKMMMKMMKKMVPTLFLTMPWSVFFESIAYNNSFRMNSSPSLRPSTQVIEKSLDPHWDYEGKTTVGFRRDTHLCVFKRMFFVDLCLVSSKKIN